MANHSAVRFTDFVSDFRQTPAINRWAIFNRPLNADSERPTFWAKRSSGLPSSSSLDACRKTIC